MTPLTARNFHSILAFILALFICAGLAWGWAMWPVLFPSEFDRIVAELTEAGP